jgi:hypothetical protein
VGAHRQIPAFLTPEGCYALRDRDGAQSGGEIPSRSVDTETPLAEVMAFSSRAFGDLLAAAESVPEEDFGRTGAQVWTGDATLLAIIPGQCYAHYEQHVDELKSISGDDIP